MEWEKEIPRLTASQHALMCSTISAGLVCMLASTLFFFWRLRALTKRQRPALALACLVTLIASYHYFQFFESFQAAYAPCFVGPNAEVNYAPTGHQSDNAYLLYLHWFLTVPLLLIEIVFVMDLPAEESFQKCLKLGVSAALMIVNGYPGEVAADPATRWVFWCLSMLPFGYIVHTLCIGMREAQDSQPEACRQYVRWACWVTVFSWCTYPIIYTVPMFRGSITDSAALDAEVIVATQLGYTTSDVMAKCVVGYLVYLAALAKSTTEVEDNAISLVGEVGWCLPPDDQLVKLV